MFWDRRALGTLRFLIFPGESAQVTPEIPDKANIRMGCDTERESLRILL
jgi:hypothetical protein